MAETKRLEVSRHTTVFPDHRDRDLRPQTSQDLQERGNRGLLAITCCFRLALGYCAPPFKTAAKTAKGCSQLKCKMDQLQGLVWKYRLTGSAW